jgi:hypothetical protein
MNEMMMLLPKWQAAASILLVFVITGCTQGKLQGLWFVYITKQLFEVTRRFEVMAIEMIQRGSGRDCGLLHSGLAGNV